MIGLPVVDPAQAQRIARAGLSGRPPAASHPPARVDPPHGAQQSPPQTQNLRESDTRYMEAPSEVLGLARTDVVPQSAQGFSLSHQPPPPAPPSDGPGLFGSTLQRTGRPEPRPPAPAPSHAGPAGPGLLSASLHAMHDPEAPKGPRTSFSTNQPPEAWRDDVRRVAEQRAPSNRPKVMPGPTTSLRLKLDGDALDEGGAYRTPKSSLPKVLAWLVVLGLLGGGAAYYAQEHGGVGAVVDQLRGARPAASPPTAPPAAAAPAAQPAATADAQPGTPAAPAQPTAAPAQPPTAAAQPGVSEGSADQSARNLADPEAPQAAPAAPVADAASPKAPQTGPKPTAAATTPAQPRAAKPKPAAKPVRRHEPVVKVRPLDGPSATTVDAPPPPPDMPYVPNPADPPAPDEPR